MRTAHRRQTSPLGKGLISQESLTRAPSDALGLGRQLVPLMLPDNRGSDGCSAGDAPVPETALQLQTRKAGNSGSATIPKPYTRHSHHIPFTMMPAQGFGFPISWRQGAGEAQRAFTSAQGSGTSPMVFRVRICLDFFHRSRIPSEEERLGLNECPKVIQDPCSRE